MILQQSPVSITNPHSKSLSLYSDPGSPGDVNKEGGGAQRNKGHLSRFSFTPSDWGTSGSVGESGSVDLGISSSPKVKASLSSQNSITNELLKSNRNSSSVSPRNSSQGSKSSGSSGQAGHRVRPSFGKSGLNTGDTGSGGSNARANRSRVRLAANPSKLQQRLSSRGEIDSGSLNNNNSNNSARGTTGGQSHRVRPSFVRGDFRTVDDVAITTNSDSTSTDT